MLKREIFLWNLFSFSFREIAYRAPAFLSLLSALIIRKTLTLQYSLSSSGPPFSIGIVGFLAFTTPFPIAITKRRAAQIQIITSFIFINKLSFNKFGRPFHLNGVWLNLSFFSSIC